MENTEVNIMTLTLERERLLRDHIEQGRIRRALADQPHGAERPDRGGVPKLARHFTNGVLRSRWRWLAMPWDEPTPRSSAAAACDA